MRTILLCDSPEHAELVDKLVFERLADEERAVGNGWSGVLTDGTRYGILWGAPVEAVVGSDGELVEDSAGEWMAYVPEPEVGP